MHSSWCGGCTARSEVPPRKAVELDPEDAKSIIGAEDLFREVPTLHCAILCPSRFGSFQVMLSGIGRYSPPRGAQAEVESESGDWIWEVTPGLQAFGMQGCWVPSCNSLKTNESISLKKLKS